MQRKARSAYVTGLAAFLVVAAAGCSGGSGDDSSASDDKPGSPTTATAAQPGKYRTLSEACGSVPRATLRDLLPGAASLPEDQQEKVYQGTAAVTYDTDRRVGCNWKSDSPDASHQLAIDVERVVSYDPAVSDDQRAQEVYGEKEAGAKLPAAGTGTPSGTGSPSASSSNSGDTGGAATSAPGADSPQGAKGSKGSNQDTAPQTGASATPVTPGGTRVGTGTASGDPSGNPSATPSGTPEGLEPRVLDDLGDAAFLDDVLARSGSAAQHRTVSVVFRTSNVIVTVRYTEQPAHPAGLPDSKELQEKARGLARTLNDQLNE
ncbi:DUF3558 domain-containing protein [Streptomyces sp. NPDC088116]|uniref:DUF3558 domain-containing protein n=1 Tax=Streptomyces sp. NPDC088116 TaxID=3365825 RepID=UPI003820863B